MSIDLFKGKWKQAEEKPTGFDAFMDAAGVYAEKRDQVSQIRFILEFEAGEGDAWICKASVEGMPEPKVYTFKFGEPYSSNDLMGKNFTCTVNKDSDKKITEHITDWSESEVVIERIVEDDKTMNVITSCKGVSFSAKYDKI